MLELYTLGSNGNYQLGLGHADDIIVPQLSLSLDADSQLRVRKITGGGNHTMILLNNGDVYECGENSLGQLDDDTSMKVISEWRKLSHEKVKDVACGWEFSSMIDMNNGVWSRGNGPKGELGLGKDILQSNTFQKIMDLNEDDNGKLFTSFQNCVLLVQKKIEKGSIIYGWGSNTKCQLLEPKSKAITEPTVIYKDDNTIIDYVAMGKNFMVFVDNNGSIVSMKGAIPDTFRLEEWQDKQGLKVYTMWSSLHIEYLGKIYSYGFSAFGQIFDNDNFYQKILKNTDSKIVKINTGSEHGIIVVKTATNVSRYSVFCWGWGEHGNCGRIKEEQSVGKSIINDYSNVTSLLNGLMSIDTEIPPDVFGGCASTWIAKYTA